MLEAASRLGLEKAIAILTMQLDPESRHFQTLLRAQTALVSTALTAQVKVDEVRLQTNRREDAARVAGEDQGCAEGALNRHRKTA